jgi:hypothetical protein
MVLLAIQLTSSKCPTVCGFRNGSGIAPLSGASPGPGRFLVEFRLTSTRAAPCRQKAFCGYFAGRGLLFA